MKNLTYGRALSYAHIATFFMGIAGVLAIAAGFRPWSTTFYRVALGGLALTLFWFLTGAKDLPSVGRTAGYLLLGVVLSVHWFAFFHALELLGVMLGSAVIGLEPLTIALAAYLILDERLPRRYGISLCISLVGFAMLTYLGYTGEGPLLSGLLWATFAFVLFAILVIANRRGVRHTPAKVITMLEMLGAIPLSWWMAERPLFPEHTTGWLTALALGLVCTGLAYSLYNASMKVLSAPVAGLLLSLEVLYGLVGGWLIGDHMLPLEWCAALLISNVLVVDLIAFWQTRRRREPSALTPSEGSRSP